MIKEEKEKRDCFPPPVPSFYRLGSAWRFGPLGIFFSFFSSLARHTTITTPFPLLGKYTGGMHSLAWQPWVSAWTQHWGANSLGLRAFERSFRNSGFREGVRFLRASEMGMVCLARNSCYPRDSVAVCRSTRVNQWDLTPFFLIVDLDAVSCLSM